MTKLPTRLIPASVLALALALGLALAMTPAGTAIQNQASASYIDSAGQPRTTTSNLVVTIVQQVYSFTITPNGTEAVPGQTRYGLPGGPVYFNYTITNTGNGTDTINLSTQQPPTGDNFDLLNPTLYLDTNCNGTIDAGESPMASPSVTLPMGGSACVILGGTIPAGTPSGQYANIDLVGTSAGNPTTKDDGNWARATATAQAILTATKSASPTGAVNPGSTITYTISGSNNGGSAASGVNVPGLGTGILVSDVIPTGLTVNAMPTGSAGAGTVQVVYSTNGGLTWSSWPPATPLIGDGTNIAVGMFIQGGPGFFPQGASYTFSFQATVPANAPVGTSYGNTATVRYNDGQTNQTVSTNSTTNTVAASYAVKVGPYEYPLGNPPANSSYLAGQYTVNRSGDTQTINSAYDGTEVIFRHTLRNTGNTSDSFSLSLSGVPTGWTCGFLANDLSTPISGPVGPVAAGGDYNFALRCSIPAGYTGGPFSLTVTATSQGNPGQSDTTSDTVNALADGFRLDLFGGPEGAPSYEQSKTTNGTNYTSDDPNAVNRPSLSPYPFANPGAQVVYRLRITNLNPNGLADNYLLSVNPTDAAAFNARVASVLFYPDGNNDGQPDGPAITNTGLLNFNQTFSYLAVVTLKPSAPPGGAPFNFEARSSTNNEVDWAYTEVWVNTVAQVVLDPDRSGTVTSPGTIQYTHTLINLSNAQAECLVQGNGGSYGWTYQYSDNGGANWYGALAPSLAPNGGSVTIHVRVIVPAGQPIGRTDVNTVTATCNVGAGTATATATETTTVVGGELRLQKSAVSYVGTSNTIRSGDGSQAYPGDVIEYTLVAENIGTGNLTQVIVTDPLPAYTEFVSVSVTAISGFPAGAQVRYSTDGTNWTPTAPTTLSTGGVIYVGVDTNGNNTIDNGDIMPPGAKITITLRVRVK